MNPMSRCLASLVVGLAVLPLTAMAASSWLTDFPAAQAQARKENKLIVVNFTGSDWCGWCKKLQKDVFTTKEFETYAKASLVLVEVDFPDKKPQTQELKSANEALQKKYRAEGYPTILVLNKDGKEVWRQVGYLAGGPTVWIEKLKSLK